MKPEQATLEAVRAKYPTLEDFWYGYFGYGFDFLTHSEANYIRTVKGNTADTIRDRILEESQSGGTQDNSGTDSQGQGNGPVLRGDKPAVSGNDDGTSGALFQASPLSNNAIAGTGFLDRVLDNAGPKRQDRWECFVYNFLDTNDPRERGGAAAGKDAVNDIVTVLPL